MKKKNSFVKNFAESHRAVPTFHMYTATNFDSGCVWRETPLVTPTPRERRIKRVGHRG